MSGLTTGIGALRENYGLRNIREILDLANQHAGSYAPAAELELIRFIPFPFGQLMWHLSTQVTEFVLDA